MLNQVILVGRLTEVPKIEELENGKKLANIILAVPRTYKNENGEYDTDFIKCVVWNGIIENSVDYFKKGDIVGIRGRLEAKENNLCVIAEKITFLSSKKVENDEDGEE